MKTISIIIIAAASLAMGGCETFVLNVLSENQLLCTRSQTTGTGDQEAQVEGGGSPTVSPTVEVHP